MNGDLLGKGILVTRPQALAETFSSRILAAHGNPIPFPVLEILDTANPSPLLALIDRLDQFDLAIFISPTAVNKAMNLVRSRREWPASLRVAAIGQGSRRELARYGLGNIIAPPRRFDSENLLAMAELQQVENWRTVIFRGDGGRELLGDELIRRGAQVEYAECYRRSRPDSNAGQLLRQWSRGEIHAVTITSSEGLRNLYDMLGKLGRQWLRSTPLFAPHERILDVAAELGLQQRILTGQGDEGMISAMSAWFAAPHG